MLGVSSNALLGSHSRITDRFAIWLVVDDVKTVSENVAGALAEVSSPAPSLPGGASGREGAERSDDIKIGGHDE